MKTKKEKARGTERTYDENESKKYRKKEMRRTK
jgi:hypothetical protein